MNTWPPAETSVGSRRRRARAAPARPQSSAGRAAITPSNALAVRCRRSSAGARDVGRGDLGDLGASAAAARRARCTPRRRARPRAPRRASASASVQLGRARSQHVDRHRRVAAELQAAREAERDAAALGRRSPASRIASRKCSTAAGAPGLRTRPAPGRRGSPRGRPAARPARGVRCAAAATGSPSDSARARGGAQRLDHPRVPARRGQRELRRDLLRRRAVRVQQPGGAAVALAAGAHGQVVVDRRRARSGARSRARRRRASARRRGTAPRAPPRRSARPARPARRRARARRPRRAARPRAPSRARVAGSRFSRCSTTVEIASGPSSRTVAASASVARSCLSSTSCSSSRMRNGLPPVVSWQAAQNPAPADGIDRRAHPLADRGAGQRRRPQQPRARVGDQPAQHLALLLGARAGAEHERDRQVLEPAREEAEEAQARLVRPLGVVDADEQRRVGGEVRAQPVEAVQAGVGGLVVARARVLEHRARQAGRAGQPAVALIGRRP